MKVNNKIRNNIWKKILCVCKTEDHQKYPLIKCQRCNFQACEDSIPKSDFIINESEVKKGKATGKKIKRKITEVTLVHGSLQDVVGWTWQ